MKPNQPSSSTPMKEEPSVEKIHCEGCPNCGKGQCQINHNKKSSPWYHCTPTNTATDNSSRAVEDWEKEFDYLTKDIVVNTGTFRRVAVKDFIRSLLFNNRKQIIQEVREFINQNQDCGACNLDVELKKFLDSPRGGG